MASDYWDRIRQSVRDFANPTDDLRCVDYRRIDEGTTCELCGHSPINNVYTLQNGRSGGTLRLGSMCIVQYRLVQERRGNATGRVFFPAAMRPLAEKINARRADTVFVLDRVTVGEAPEMLSLDINGDLVAQSDYETDLLDDLAPEGLGSDEIDWDSESPEQN